MKKKILAVVLTAVMALGCFSLVTAKAQDKANKWLENGADTDEDVAVSEDEGLEVTSFEAATGVSAAEGLAHLAAQFTSDKCVVAFGVTGDDLEGEAATVTITDVNIKSGKTYALRHMNKSTGEWSNTGISVVAVKSGLAKFKVTKAGGYALVEAKTGNKAENPSSTTSVVTPTKNNTVVNNNTAKKTPKTGEV